MSAPAVSTDIEPIATFDEFECMCADYADWWRVGILDRITAIDCVQRHAELWGWADAGQDRVQAAMAEAFSPRDEVPLAEDHARRIIARWEADDAGRPATPAALKPRYSTPDAVVQAFWIVADRNDPTCLAEWLKQHPADMSHLRKIWEAKCSTAAA